MPVPNTGLAYAHAACNVDGGAAARMGLLMYGRIGKARPKIATAAP